MTRSDWSALISLGVAAAVLVAGFFQWWSIGLNGEMWTRGWVKSLFVILIFALGVAATLLVTQTIDDRGISTPPTTATLVPVPNVIGLTPADAFVPLRAADMKWAIVRVRVRAVRDAIVSETPLPGTQVAPGTVVRLGVSPP